MLTDLFLKGRGRELLDDEELAALEGAITERRELPARRPVVRRGEPVRESILLLDGLMCRYLDDQDGQRQVLSVHVAGDFVDLHGFPMRRLDHEIGTLTACTVAIADHQALVDITRRYPRLTRFLWFATLLDAAMHREWIFRLGRLGAQGRVAHFFCELNARLTLVGLAADNRFALPLTQADLAEACGITGVHVNRTLRVLREAGVMVFQNGRVQIADLPRLMRVAEFDPDYLYGTGSAWFINGSSEENRR